MEAAEAVGLEAGGYEADLENLSDLDSPCVFHVSKGERQHYVVCYGTADGKFLIGDPESGVDELHPAMLAKRWQSRVLLTAEPTEDFEAQVAAVRGTSTESSVEEYQCLGVDSAPLGRNQMLVETAETDEPHLLPSGLGQILLSLDRFDTLEHHADTCIRALNQQQGDDGEVAQADVSTPEEKKQDVKLQLRRFAEEGLLTAKSEVRETVRSLQDRNGDAPPPITSIGIPTAGRSESLRRALTSYAKDARGRDVPTRLVVMDDAEDPEEQRAALRVVEELYYNTYGERLAADRIRDMIAMREQYARVGYLTVPLFVALRVAYAALCISVGAILAEYSEMSYRRLFKAALLCEGVFFLRSAANTFWNSVVADPQTLQEAGSALPTSVVALVNTSEVPQWALYPLQTLNLFEVLYIVAVSGTLAWMFDRDWAETSILTLSSYGIGLLLWIAAATFFLVQIS